MDLNQQLKRHFGFAGFRDGQREVIEHLLEGRSAAAIFPTGSGKSLCYQLPAMILPGLTLVVSPLIALMKDQIDALKVRDIAAARLDSTLSAQEYKAVLKRAQGGDLKLLYVAPERFNNELFRAAVKRLNIALFAVDEAHCISEWGHNFRPDYLKLALHAREIGAERVLALTATATPKVQDDICQGFGIAPRALVRTGFYRPNLTILTTPVEDEDRVACLAARLRARPAGSVIVYVTLQRTAEEVAQALQSMGFSARAYHAGMHDETRSAVQDWFMTAPDAIVVATIAFGMGVDKANIRYVYHFNLAKSLENYVQEIGRAGRDGETSVCEMFVCPDDMNVLENFVYGDTPALAAVHAWVAQLADTGDEFDVSLQSMANASDIRPLVLRTLLTYLELDGWLQGGTPVYGSYRFRERTPRADILARFDAERRQFLADLFDAARKAKSWWHLDLDSVARQINSPRDRIVKALDFLGAQGLLDVSPSGLLLRFRWRRPVSDTEHLARQLYARVRQREAAELRRLQRVLEFAGSSDCQASYLSAYFDAPLKQPCGHCTPCLNKGPVAMNRAAVSISDGVWDKLSAVRGEYAAQLRDARNFARFCCGVTSPALVRARLSSNAMFGALSHVPFAQVLERAEVN